MQLTVKVRDLSCDECVNAIESLCKALPFVEEVQYINREEKIRITGTSEMRTDWVLLAIEEAGYQIETDVSIDIH